MSGAAMQHASSPGVAAWMFSFTSLPAWAGTLFSSTASAFLVLGDHRGYLGLADDARDAP